MCFLAMMSSDGKILDYTNRNKQFVKVAPD